VREEKIRRNHLRFRVITVEFVFANYLIVNEIFFCQSKTPKLDLSA